MTQYQVYWIHKSEHKNPLTEGYVGVTTVQPGRGQARRADHFLKLRNKSHPNPKLQNAFNKHGSLNFTILKSGTKLDCLEYERSLRPQRNIAWNIMEGGNVPPSQKGRRWFTNGVETVKAFACPEGFHSGRITVSGPAHGHYGKPKTYPINYSPEFLARQRRIK